MRHYLYLLILPLLFSSCTALKAVKCGSPSTDTYRNFAVDTISALDAPRAVLIDSEQHSRTFEESKFNGGGFNHETIGEYFARVRGNGALLIVRNDSVLLEQYYGNFSKQTPSNIFSLTKAVTSLLCGIAIDEGKMSLSDPVTAYIPELNDADPLFKELTIEHLLDMRTGLDFEESYGYNPFSKMANLYYGKDVVNQIKKLHFKHKPGEKHYYNSMSTAILGVALERAAGVPYAEYLQEKVWKPLQMESPALITLDDDKHRQAKAYGGLVTNVRDLAKIGRLYLNGGVYDGKRIVSKDWVERSTHASLDNEAYSLAWNNIITRIDDKDVVTPRFFGLGLYGQVIFCDPDQNLIFVTLIRKAASSSCYLTICALSSQSEKFCRPERSVRPLDNKKS